MDPISITTIALTSAKVLCVVGKRLHQEYRNFREQDKTIKGFCDSADAILSIIQSCEDFFGRNKMLQNQPHCQGIRSSLNKQLEDCYRCTEETYSIISKLERSSNPLSRQLRLRSFEGDLEKQRKEIDRYLSRLKMALALLQFAKEDSYKPLIRSFDSLVPENGQVWVRRSPEQKHVMIAMQRLLDKQSHLMPPQSTQSSNHLCQPSLQMIQTKNQHMSLEFWLANVQGLPVESHDLLVTQSMVEMLDLEYSQNDVDPYTPPIRRLYQVLVRAGDNVVLRSDMRPRLIEAVTQCRFSDHEQEYLSSIRPVESIMQPEFETLFRSLVKISMKLERARVKEIVETSYEAGLLELKLENQRREVEDPSESYHPKERGSRYSNGSSFQYIAWGLTRVWTHRLRHLERLWRSKGERNFCDEEETRKVLDLTILTSSFGDILQAEGELLDLLELASNRLPFNETAYKDFPHGDVQRMASSCRDMFIGLSSLVVEFKTTDARKAMQKQDRKYEEDFTRYQMEYIDRPMHRGDWIRLGISMRLDSINELAKDSHKSISRCKVWVVKNFNFTETILRACQATNSFQRELENELQAKVSSLQSRALKQQVTVTFTNLRLEGLKKPKFFDRKKTFKIQIGVKRNGVFSPTSEVLYAITQRSGDAPPSWSEKFQLKLYSNDEVHILVSYDGARDFIAHASYQPSRCVDFYKGQTKNLHISVPDSSLRIMHTVRCPPSRMSKEEVLPLNHRPGGWIGRHTAQVPTRSYHKRYMTGEYTLLDPIEETAGRTVVPILVETVAKMPILGGVVGAVADQVGMASGFVYGKLWGSWT